MTQINLDFVAEYIGRQHVKNATSDVLGLGSAAKKLAGLFTVGAVVAFGKASVTAFTEANQSFKVLGNTLSNLGLEAQGVGISDYIDKLSLATGTVKQTLIPAFSTLATYTHDVSKSQELLNLALDISAGTGKDLTTVTTALGKAYGGSNTALGKLGAGLTAAELKQNSFAKNQKILTATWGGDAAAAADTYAGRISRLGAAFTIMKENIGQGLVLGFEGANSSASSFADTLDRITQSGTVIGAIFGGIFKKLSEIGNIPVLGSLVKMVVSGWGEILGVQKSVVAAHEQLLRENDLAQQKATKDAAAQAKILAESIKAQKAADAASLAASKQKLKDARDALNLKLAGSTTDMQNIEIQAALQRGQTAQVNDVLLLQRAILNGNGDQAEILAQKVLTANNLVMDVQGNISSLSTAKDPFADWPAASASAMKDIQALELELAKLVAKPYVIQIQYATNGVPLAPTISPGGSVNTGNGKGGPTDYSNYVGTASGIVNPSVTSINPINGADRNGTGGVTVNFTVDGTTIATAIAPAVQDAIVQNTASGTAAVYSRSSTARVGDW